MSATSPQGSHGSSDQPPEPLPADAARSIVATMMGLGPIISQFCCVLAQPELMTPQFEALGFHSIVTSDTFSIDFWDHTKTGKPEAKGLLITQMGLRVDPRTVEMARALSRNACVPSILVVAIAELDQIQMCGDASARSKLAANQHRAQGAFIGNGADDVILLDLHEKLTGQRVLEAVHRIEILARRLSQEIDTIQQQASKKVEEVKELASRKLQVAWKNQMWSLPGAVLESIPAEDTSISEWPAREQSGLGGVGTYSFEAKLGGGSFGTVFKATSKDRGSVAVKVIQKSSVKNVSQLFSLNQELGIMQHVSPHSHVASALTAFHTANCIYLVMEFAGSMSLHKFVRSTLASEQAQALPRDTARSFCCQMGIALAHLHGLMVCHRDLKPANFIVSDTGHNLQLVDFGFAAMLCSKEQRLTACCGSLPFCAPEVLASTAGNGRSYNPFAADIWSLSLNFVEMACGPYSIEKCLGWVPQHPQDAEQRKKDVNRLEAIWKSTPDTGIEGLGRTISNMLLIQADTRWNILQVLGQEGLGVGLSPAPPPRRGRSFKLQKEFGPAGAPASSTSSTTIGGPNGGMISTISNNANTNTSNNNNNNNTNTTNSNINHNHGTTSSSYGHGHGHSVAIHGHIVVGGGQRPGTAEEVASDKSASLLERMGGPGPVRQVVEKMLETAMKSTLVGVVLGRSAASVPTLRSLYSEEIQAFFETVPGQGREQQVLDRLGDAHRPWDFSDAAFDALADHFLQALTSVGIQSVVKQEAVGRFKSLRVKITAGYRDGCSFARKQNTAGWRAKLVAEVESGERIASFARAFATIITRHPRLGVKVPLELRDVEKLKAQMLAYLNSEVKISSPVLLDIPSVPLVDLWELIDSARQALVESTWSPDEVLLLQFAMSDHWDHIRLNRALDDLAVQSRSADRVSWTTFTLRLQSSFMNSPSNRLLCENMALPMCLARISEVLSSQLCEDPWQLSFNSCSLSITDAHFDSLIEMAPSACMDLPPTATPRVMVAMQAMRAFVVQGCTNTARAG